MKEFVNEYQALRYGGTDKVIEYFRSELKRIGKELTNYEDDLTQYNVTNRIINYYDETKEIAAINKEFELREQDVLFNYNSSKAMLNELEKQMDSNIKRVIHNVQLVDKINQASDLTGKITQMETISTSSEDSGRQLLEYKNKLLQTRRDLSEISNQYVAGQYTKEGLNKGTIVEQWLDQLLLFEKAKAELKIVQKSRNELNAKYLHFAPVGTTIKRKERIINFTEQNYLTNLKSYNDALLRKKSLEMTAAILKVLNPPAYPINSESTNRRKIVMMIGVGSFIGLIAFFLLIEFIDRTLRDSVRTRKQTGSPVLGAYPAPMKFSPISKQCEDIATRYMSSSILRFFTQKKEGMPYILNMLSTEDGSGKTYLANRLKVYWEGIGLHVRMLSDGTDFDSNSSKYALANTITDLYIPQEEDILIIEQPSLNRANIPVSILQDAQLNLVIASADHGWKDIDKMLLQKLKAQLGKAPYLYLNWAPKYEVETYTGMLPPYTFLHKQLYRLSQLALTESFIRWKKNSRKIIRTTITMTMNNEEEIYNRDPHQSSRSFYVLFALQFLPILASIFIEVKLGIATLAIIVPMTFITLIACSNRQTDWSHSRNIILLLFFIWGIYCLLEISNPNNVQEAWNISIGHYLFIPIICAVLVPISIRDRKGIESLLFIWGIFILIVTIKGYWQKNHGFTDKELYFLYTLGGARTHIIWSGIRYFSCFSDAANYGVHSAMAASAFGIAMFYVQKRWMKVFLHLS